MGHEEILPPSMDSQNVLDSSFSENHGQSPRLLPAESFTANIVTLKAEVTKTSQELDHWRGVAEKEQRSRETAEHQSRDLTNSMTILAARNRHLEGETKKMAALVTNLRARIVMSHKETEIVLHSLQKIRRLTRLD